MSILMSMVYSASMTIDQTTEHLGFQIRELPQPFCGTELAQTSELFMSTVYRGLPHKYWKLGLEIPPNEQQLRIAFNGLDSPDTHIFVAETTINDELVIMGALMYLSQPNSNLSQLLNMFRRLSVSVRGLHEIKLLAIGYPYRRRGLGSQLMATAECFAQTEYAAPGIILNHVLDAGDPLYRKLGYTPAPALIPSLQGKRFVKFFSQS